MKTKYKKIFSISSLAAITLLCVVSCKDEVLVPVKDETSADSLISIIDVLDAQKITLDKKLNKITITNANLLDSANSLNSTSNDVEVEYTVNVLNGGTTITGGRTKGVNGVSVTVLQNGVSKVVTSADGRAIFTGLTQGAATVSLNAANFATVNATVYLGSNSTGSYGDGAIREVSSNFLMIPIGGSDGLTIKGNLYINRNVLNDTLGRQFEKSGDAKETQYISNPGKWDHYNYNGYGYGYLYNLYDNSVSYNYNPIVSFDALTSASTVYAYPDLSTTYNPSNWANDGYITSISYVGLMSWATVDANGAYTINVPYVYNSAGTDNFGYYIEATDLVDNLTRFDDLASYNGSTQGTPGSVKTTFKLFNNTDYSHSTTDRYVLTESWTFKSGITYEGDWDAFGEGYIDGGATSPGATVFSNIYYFPYSKNY
jgi:hypothetical protein